MRARFLAFGLLVGCVGSATAAAGQKPLPTGVLTHAAQVRDLTPAQAAQARPVHLTGVMLDTADADRGHAIVLADYTAGIYVLADRNLFAADHRGDRVEIKGVTDPGQFAPIVKAKTARKLGRAAIPKARPVTYQQLITGALDAQWVEIRGVVRRSFKPQAGSDIYRIVIGADGGLIPVRLYSGRPGPVQVDAEVRVRALCFYQFNQKGQVLSPVLQVPRGVSVLVERPAPAKPFATRVRSADSLFMFSPGNLHAYAHRVHVRGVVTCYQPGSYVWIRDGHAGLRIQSRQHTKLQPGDVVDVLGFPAFGSSSPVLQDAVFRKSGSASPPVPLDLARPAQAYNHEDDLVVVEGELTQIQAVLDGLALTLTKDGQHFRAVLKRSPGQPGLPDWQAGSEVRITGICSLIHDEARPLPGIWQPKSFQILLRSPADLSVIEPPPWWTPTHIIMLLGMVTGALVLLIGLVMALSRRRLREHGRQREMAEAEFAAILSERNRLSREIHDTLAQGLAATSVHLRLARKHLNGVSEATGRHLNTALQLVRESLEEARNSIWNMRSHVLESDDLSGALKGVLLQMADGTDLKTSFEVSGRVRRLAPVMENNILRAGQEAITNAAKHSGAKAIRVKLNYGEKEFSLRVTDDGCGFDPQHPPPTNGGFGLLGMRERAAEMNGELNVRSAPGQGAEIVLSAPLSTE